MSVRQVICVDMYCVILYICKTYTLCWCCIILCIRRYLHRLSSTTLKYTETSWCKTPGWVTSTTRTGASGRTDCSYSSSGASPGRSWYYLTTAYLWQFIGMLLQRTWVSSKRYGNVGVCALTITHHMRLEERLAEEEDIYLPYPAATDDTLVRVCLSESQRDTSNKEFHYGYTFCFTLLILSLPRLQTILISQRSWIW